MYKLKYNIVALFQVVFSLLVFVLLIRNYGASAESDVFLMAVAITSALNLIQLMFVEQFLFFYNDKKDISATAASAFYKSSLAMALVIGVLIALFSWALSDVIVYLFAESIDPERKALLLKLISYLAIGLAVYPASYVNDRLLNSEDYYSVPYLLESLPFVVLTVLMLSGEVYSYSISVDMLAIARSLSLLSGFFIGFLVIYKIGAVRPGVISFRESGLIDFIKNSFKMRFAHNIHNVGMNLIINNMLSKFGVGVASYYYYANRGVTILKTVVIGPQYRVYQSKISRLWSSGDKDGVVAFFKDFRMKSGLMYVGCSVIAYFFAPFLLKIISTKNFGSADIENTCILFGFLCGWHLFVVLEFSSVTILMAAKKSIYFLIANSIYVIGVCFFVISVEITDIYVLVIVLMAFQAFSLLLYSLFKDKEIKTLCQNSKF